jgi:hypothetical protein
MSEVEIEIGGLQCLNYPSGGFWEPIRIKIVGFVEIGRGFELTPYRRLRDRMLD